ncbi:MAG TPA: hypothetical protein VIA62_17955 [Thermoanaerobaculia bacterium]|jgi:NADPH-dependent 2,4-dienoyl-CoA reductase/sulfur reductase-like enzyme|nr:hypothetical protein [Thermoanaerobaculia bacterium]
MTHDEYEQRKRRLEEELRAGVELLETAHRHQLRALQLVWAATGGEGVEIPPPVVATAAMETPPAVPALSAPTEPPQPARRGAWALYNDVQTVLAEVPELFDRNDVCRALGYEPDRGSLYRTFLELKQEGVLAVEEVGYGRLPTRYRKTFSSDATVAE